MKIQTCALAAYLATSALAAHGHAQTTGGEPRLHVRVETAHVAAVRAALERARYDVLASSLEDSTIDLAVSRGEWQALAAEGYSVAVVERARPLREALRSSGTARAPAGGGTSVAAAALPPATYRDLDGVLGRMQEIAAAYPAIAQIVDVTAALGSPATSEGRHLFALKISDNVAIDEDEPAMLVVGGHHAREIVAPVIALEAAERLTGGYATDIRIASAVNAHEIWIAPVWNPDGYNYVFTTDNLWRKNRRVFATGVGVDQNRNYPQGWGASCAGSASVGSETYKGPSAASEAETQTMMAWSERERFAKVIDYHSTGREVLYAYNCLNHPFTTWMREEATSLSQTSGYGGATRRPSAEGEHQEWQLARMGAYAFLIETHTEFQPSYDSAVSEAAQLWPGILAVLERPITISGHVTDASTGLPVAARIDLPNIAFSNGETNAGGGAYGAFHMFLPPGTYDIRFSATGYASLTRRVSVTATSSAVLNVQLAPAPLTTPTGLRIVR